MKRETTAYLDKARQSLVKAKANLAVEFPDEAGRHAYYAAFHAAQALIFEQTGKSAKTHKGVHKEFAKLTKDDAQVDKELQPFLVRAYDLKTAADYETGAEACVTAAQAASAIETAQRFVDCVAGMIDPPPSSEKPDEPPPS